MQTSAEALRNDGIIRLNEADALGVPTFIVTGMARSGTSMVARALIVAGVDMGTSRDDIVFEDVDIARALPDPVALAKMIAARNSSARPWGFKRPHLFTLVGPQVSAAFRNPRFIVTYRDPVAIARRYTISEHFYPATSLRDAAEGIGRCVEFVLQLAAPVLLVSYEKALQQPEVFVDHLIAFCGLTPSPGDRARMIHSIEADRPEYLHAARRRYEGHVDRCARGSVYGWCRQVGLDEPLLLDIVVDDSEPIHVIADQARPDLAAAGFSFIRHGFSVDITHLIRTGREKVTVQVHGRRFELQGSGKTVRELIERVGGSR